MPAPPSATRPRRAGCIAWPAASTRRTPTRPPSRRPSGAAILAREFPGAVVVDASARDGRPTAGRLFVDHPRRSRLELPGLVIEPRDGPGPVEGDEPGPGGIFTEFGGARASRQSGRRESATPPARRGGAMDRGPAGVRRRRQPRGDPPSREPSRAGDPAAGGARSAERDHRLGGRGPTGSRGCGTGAAAKEQRPAPAPRPRHVTRQRRVLLRHQGPRRPGDRRRRHVPSQSSRLAPCGSSTSRHWRRPSPPSRPRSRRRAFAWRRVGPSSPSTKPPSLLLSTATAHARRGGRRRLRGRRGRRATRRGDRCPRALPPGVRAQVRGSDRPGPARLPGPPAITPRRPDGTPSRGRARSAA